MKPAYKFHRDPLKSRMHLLSLHKVEVGRPEVLGVGRKKKAVTSRQAVPGQYFLARGLVANGIGRWNSNHSPEVTALRVC